MGKFLFIAEQTGTTCVHRSLPAKFLGECKPNSPCINSPSSLCSFVFRLMIFIWHLLKANPCAGWYKRRRIHEFSRLYKQRIFTCLKLRWQCEMAQIETVDDDTGSWWHLQAGLDHQLRGASWLYPQHLEQCRAHNKGSWICWTDEWIRAWRKERQLRDWAFLPFQSWVFVLTVWRSAGFLISLSLSVFICKTGLTWTP